MAFREIGKGCATSPVKRNNLSCKDKVWGDFHGPYSLSRQE